HVAAGHHAPELSPATQGVQRQAVAPQPTARSGRRISVGTSIRGEPFVINVDLTDTTAPFFDADPSAAGQLGEALVKLFNPPEGPVPETTRFLAGPRVKALIE